MGFKSDGVKWTWSDSTTTGEPLQYTTTHTTGDPIEIKAPEWKIGDKIIINSPITDDTHTAPAPSKNAMDVRPIQYGWVCPKCGRVNSPYTSTCWCWCLGSDGIPKITC